MSERTAALTLALVTLVLTDCTAEPAFDDVSQDSGAPAACTVLFGIAGPKTGLDSDACRPECLCGTDPWRPPSYDDGQVAALLDWTLLDPPAALDSNPYTDPSAHPEQTGKLCSFVADTADPHAYRLQTSDAAAPTGTVTHAGACGLCSSLVDLAVYLRHADLTDPVRACGLKGLTDGEQANLDCLAELGFSEPCAQIWYWNTVNTRSRCAGECFAALDAPYHEPDGSLNTCLACDNEYLEVWWCLARRAVRPVQAADDHVVHGDVLVLADEQLGAPRRRPNDVHAPKAVL